MQDSQDKTRPATSERLAVVLRRATAETHQAVERLPLMTRLTSPTVTRNDYLDYLHALADVYAALEDSLLDALDEEIRNDLGVRRKLPAILEDLAEQGQPHEPRSSAQPPPSGAAAALGGLYVLEGATLGGRVIAKHLRRCLGPTLGSATFLDFHGEHSSAAWKRFASILDSLPAHGRMDPAEVVSGARESFAAVHRMLEGTGARGAPDRADPDHVGPRCPGRRHLAETAPPIPEE
ncbi:biliverdin-producing heme oxygenase [Thiocapsa marina]|uniref:Heme oxygenase-like protein n=1 Tax=Thiocapsa marina 5811 TaxID=768671 RepID=F9UGP7_9GAMM|nr:biliverdin-producing heme oxygenase [Thiocapsa marina]EGV16730.1 heme oxygenase-like protein [Thiocapsa marina 5811]